MDVQMKRGLLEICVLSAIRDSDSYGYRIIKDLKPYMEISESTLYPILRRLEAAGRARCADFPLLMHIDELLSEHRKLNIPWEAMARQ